MCSRKSLDYLVYVRTRLVLQPQAPPPSAPPPSPLDHWRAALALDRRALRAHRREGAVPLRPQAERQPHTLRRRQDYTRPPSVPRLQAQAAEDVDVPVFRARGREGPATVAGGRGPEPDPLESKAVRSPYILFGRLFICP